MLIGIAVVAGLVALCLLLSKAFFDKLQIGEGAENLFIASIQIAIALAAYVFLFRSYEKRQIKELNTRAFPRNAFFGFVAGFVLQSLSILVIYIAGGYSITKLNPVSFLLPAFTSAIVAGFVAEILIRGIIFRLVEE